MQADASIDVVCFNGSSSPLRIAVVTETYPPDINGVAYTLSKTVEGLKARGHALWLIRPRQNKDAVKSGPSLADETLVRGMPIPFYKHLKMGFPAKRALTRLWTLHRPDVVHIATEGPLGWSALQAAKKLKLPVSSDFRTNFHAYSDHYGIGWLRGAIMNYMRKFHNAALATMVPTPGLASELSARRTMEELAQINATLVRTATGNMGRRPTVMLAPELSKAQRKAVKAFELERWFPTVISCIDRAPERA